MRIITLKARLAVCLVIVSVILAGCDSAGQGTPTPAPTPGAAGAQNGQVKDLSLILADGPNFQDLKSDSVAVKIDTTIPVVCAAAYGTTTTYGQLSTDTTMAGTGHTNHLPVLDGLKPDTEYHLRLQGVGADGTLYQSKDYTFRTPQAQPAAPSRPERTLRCYQMVRR